MTFHIASPAAPSLKIVAEKPIAYSMSSFVKGGKKASALVCLVHKRPTAIIKEPSSLKAKQEDWRGREGDRAQVGGGLGNKACFAK